MKRVAGSSWLGALLCAAVLAGCGGGGASTQPGDDAGIGADAGAGTDAGMQADAGAPLDAGADAGPDAGMDAGPDAGADAGIDAGADAGIDAGSPSDAGADAGSDAGADGGAACTASADYGADTPANQTADYYTQADEYEYNGDLNADAQPDHLIIQLHDAKGVFSSGFATGTYQLAGAELSYATCGLCVYIFTDPNTSAQSAADVYFATGGTVTITQLTPSLQGTLSNATFAHVTIANDGTTTQVDDGCDSRIGSLAFNAAVTTHAPVCTATADYQTVAPMHQQAAYKPSADGYIYTAALNSDAAPDLIQMGLLNGYGVFANGVAPGNYVLAGKDLNYATCGLCLLIETNTNASGAATDIYFATGGTVDITSVTPTLAGQIIDATFTHVTISSNGTMTVVGDCNSKLEELDFDTANAAPNFVAGGSHRSVTPDLQTASRRLQLHLR